MQKWIFSLSAFLAIILYSCGNDRLKIDVSSVNLQTININRLEKDLFSMNPATIGTYSNAMVKKYGNFYNSFIYNVINHGDVPDSAFKSVAAFLKDNDIKSVYDEVLKKYPDTEIEKISTELTLAFKHFKWHFPKQQIPVHYATYISGFTYNILPIDSTLGMGLDMYLGSNSKFYSMLEWPKYKNRCLSREYLVPDCMRGWLINAFDKNEPIDNLINHMIFYGKLYYCMDAVVPDVNDSIKIGYSAEQMNYCKRFEKKLWGHFTEQDRLYKNDLKVVAEYTSDGPFSSAIGKECPPRIAYWVGWQIVRAYMQKNKDITLEQLMDEKDAQKILTKSKYKP